MLEIEMKFPVADFAAVERGLSACGARRGETLVEADHYYNAPDRDFRRTDEALRLRRVGAKNVATYKGPKLPGPTKTRQELEVALRDGDDAAQEFCSLLEHLGYRPVAVVRKTRTTHHLQRGGFDLAACLDDVERVGRYVELEIVAPEEHRQRAEEELLGLARELGLEHPEPRSYLRLLVGKR
jgi:adenylate cyclase class 2